MSEIMQLQNKNFFGFCLCYHRTQLMISKQHSLEDLKELIKGVEHFTSNLVISLSQAENEQCSAQGLDIVKVCSGKELCNHNWKEIKNVVDR